MPADQNPIDRLVVHPKRPEWGPGRVLAVDGTRWTVYFRDLRASSADDAPKVIDTRYVELQDSEPASDPFLDNLPPFRDGRFERTVARRQTMDEAIERFETEYPLGFRDPAYVGDATTGERAYKLIAHEAWVETLGDGQGLGLLERGEIAELSRRALSVEGKLNLLAVFEKAAFREGLRDERAARRYFQRLFALLQTERIDREVLDPYLQAVEALPAEGGTSPAKWTVATILPFVAQPDRFMFLKPMITQEAADRMMWDLRYRPDLDPEVYLRLLEMSGFLLEKLRPLGAEDFIDVQSFLWLLGS